MSRLRSRHFLEVPSVAAECQFLGDWFNAGKQLSGELPYWQFEAPLVTC